MRAVRLYGYGGVDQFRYEDMPDPIPGPCDVLVQVAAAAVNPIDIKLRNGAFKDWMPLTLPAVLGSDFSGTIISSGPNVTDRKVGDRVIGMINPMVNGSYADLVVAPANLTTIVPDGIDLVEAAALPTGALTGIQLIEKGLAAKAGDRILVVGAAGSVGRAAVQAAIGLGARVTAGVRRSAKDALSDVALEAVVALDDTTELARLAPFDCIADTVGGKVAEELFQYLRPDGVLASVVFPPPAGHARYSGIRAVSVTVSFDGHRLSRFAEGIASRQVTLPTARRLALSEFGKAHATQERGGVRGKVLLLPDPKEA